MVKHYNLLSQKVSASDEADLCRKLTKLFNKKGFKFEFINSYVDLEDDINHILIEVKNELAKNGAFQILYAITKNKLTDIQYLGFADSVWLSLYKCPDNRLLFDFVSSEVANVFTSSPSEWSGKNVERAIEFLENNATEKYYSLNKDFSLEALKKAETWLDKKNIMHVYEIFSKYGINMSDFVAAHGDLDIIDVKVFDNRIDVQRKDKTISVNITNGPVDIFDKYLIQRMRIKDAKHLEDIRQRLDQFRNNRPNDGAYYTEKELSIKCGKKVLELVNPDWIAEPMAGAGSLLIPFVDDGYTTGWINDYAKEAFEPLKSEYSKYGFIVTNKDVVNMSIDEIVSMVGDAKNPLFITNPPFSSTHGKATKIGYGPKIYSIQRGKKIKHYVDLGDLYGRGNQIYPTIGKIIEVIKQLGRGYLAFFAPFGIFCERKAHMKFLSGLLDNFTFLYGSIWSGKGFNNVSKDKPITFTVWKYGNSTDLETIKFDLACNQKIGFKRFILLKQGWKYLANTCDNEILVGRNDNFSCPVNKIFVFDGSLSGARLIKGNVKLDLNVLNIPSELIYGLWSTIVGSRAIVKHPLHFDNAYVHMPDFTKKETNEILAYGLLYAFVEKDYTNGLIGFVGSKKIFKFGKSKRLNDGAKYLFNTYGYLNVGNQTITEVLDDIKNGICKKEWKKLIRDEISERLEVIGYWDYIPLPLK